MYSFETGAVVGVLMADGRFCTAPCALIACLVLSYFSFAPLNPGYYRQPYSYAPPPQIRTWRAHKLPVSDMAIDASGGYVATASADRSVKVWDLQGGFCTHSFTGHSGVVLRVIFHPKQVMRGGQE